MKIHALGIPGMFRIEPRVFRDDRGFFVETYSSQRYAEAGIPEVFVQDNLSRSGRGTLRGLHLQHPFGQGKLVHVVEGEVFDVAVDVRVGSPSFGQWVGVTLSGDDQVQLYLPPGLAHGFCVLSPTALFSYKCTELYHPEAELGVAWNDPHLAIDWPVEDPLVSPKDLGYRPLREIPETQLPSFVAS